MKILSRRRSRIHAKVPFPNDNRTFSCGTKILVESVFSDTGLNDFLDGLKRDQGERVSNEVVALVANSVEMTGISVNRLDRMLSDDSLRKEYGSGNSHVKSIYRTVDRIGDHSDEIVRYLGMVLRTKYNVNMDVVFTDWTSMYFETSPNSVIKFGYSRDHRSDRPQINVGLSMDRDSGMPIGLTMVPGNILDVTHFEDTFKQISPLLNKDSVIVFDNGAYSKKNSDLLEENGIGFVTRLELNKSEIDHVKCHQSEWNMVDDEIMCMERTGYLGRKRHIFFSLKCQLEMFDQYRRKAEHDYDEMEEMRLALEYGKKPRKKYRNGNCFVNTHLSYQFPLKGIDRDSAIDIAVKSMVTGREGLFTLMSNRTFSPSKVLELYRSRNSIETAFRDLKHGIDWRPANCSKPSAIRGRILVSFLALFCMSMVRFLYPEFRHLSAESMTEQLTTFSLTLRRHQDGSEDRIFSNFCPIIRRLRGMKSSLPSRKSPDQTSITSFAA